MTKLTTAAAALVISLSSMVPGQTLAQSNTIDAVMTTCTDVINLQYDDDHSRDTQCISAVGTFVAYIGAVSAGADPQIADLILRLLELYREDPSCKIVETELPEAIQLAAGHVFDEEVKLEYVLIYDQVNSCDFTSTAAIDPDPVPASRS